MAEQKQSKGTVRIRWVRSYIASPMKHKKIVKGLGFTRLNQVLEREDTPSIRGMVKKVPHLLEIVQ
jgi:large subunit ribosomal protein L30